MCVWIWNTYRKYRPTYYVNNSSARCVWIKPHILSSQLLKLLERKCSLYVYRSHFNKVLCIRFFSRFTWHICMHIFTIPSVDTSCNVVTCLAESVCGLKRILYWLSCSTGRKSRERGHRGTAGRRDVQLDSDEKSICYRATIHYVRTNARATEGFQK